MEDKKLSFGDEIWTIFSFKSFPWLLEDSLKLQVEIRYWTNFIKWLKREAEWHVW